MVSEGYINRLREYIAAECGEHVRRPGDKGVNAYARYTERVLSDWRMSGFAAGQISRWLRGEVKADLDGSTLQRLGLLKGLSREPEEAGKLAWAWLNGEDVPEAAPPRNTAAELPARYRAGPNRVVEQISSGKYGLRELREIAIAAIDQLTDSAESGAREEEEPEPVESAVTWLLQGWMTQQGNTIVDLAATIGTSVERAEKIMLGYPMQEDECWAVAKITKLKPETLIEWGVCPSAMAETPSADRSGI